MMPEVSMEGVEFAVAGMIGFLIGLAIWIWWLWKCPYTKFK